MPGPFDQIRRQIWIGSLFRLVWVLPLEPMGALHRTTASPRPRQAVPDSEGETTPVAQATAYRSTYAGSSLATRIYPLLFSPTPCELACWVDLEPLLRFAKQGIYTDSAETGKCWLLHRIIETQGLMKDLTSRVGYTSDFEPDCPFRDPDIPVSELSLLISSSSETILRCILLQS